MDEQKGGIDNKHVSLSLQCLNLLMKKELEYGLNTKWTLTKISGHAHSVTAANSCSRHIQWQH